MNKYIKQYIWVAIALLGWLAMALPAQATSFDCSKAATKVEKLICDDAVLSKLDDELNAAYKNALQNEKQAGSVRQTQKQWMEERNDCYNAACLNGTYVIRLSTLTTSPAVGAKQISVGKYKMIGDSIDAPQPANAPSMPEKHAEVCTAFLKVLEASTSSFPPMVCDVKFKPEFTDFKTPEWQDVDVWENRDLELQVGQRKPENEAEKELWLSNIKSYVKAGMLAYQTARFDIDNDGVPDQVLARIRGKCDPSNKKNNIAWIWRSYAVYDPVTRKLDVEKAKFYGFYWDDKSLFSYKGVTYYASLFQDTTNVPYFGKLERPDKNGSLPTKYFIKLFRPLPIEQGLHTTFKQPVALGCVYLYLPLKNAGGY